MVQFYVHGAYAWDFGDDRRGSRRKQEDVTGEQSLLLLDVGGQRLALPSASVGEVLAAARPEPLPGAPAPVIGLVDLRGSVLAVLDGRRLLGMASAPVVATDRFVVLDVGGTRRMLRVDAAIDLVDAPVLSLRQAVADAPRIMSAAGIARMPDGLLVVHDPERFLSQRDTEALEQALADQRTRLCG